MSPSNGEQLITINDKIDRWCEKPAFENLMNFSAYKMGPLTKKASLVWFVRTLLKDLIIENTQIIFHCTLIIISFEKYKVFEILPYPIY